MTQFLSLYFHVRITYSTLLKKNSIVDALGNPRYSLLHCRDGNCRRTSSWTKLRLSAQISGDCVLPAFRAVCRNGGIFRYAIECEFGTPFEKIVIEKKKATSAPARNSLTVGKKSTGVKVRFLVLRKMQQEQQKRRVIEN